MWRSWLRKFESIQFQIQNLTHMSIFDFLKVQERTCLKIKCSTSSQPMLWSDKVLRELFNYVHVSRNGETVLLSCGVNKNHFPYSIPDEIFMKFAQMHFLNRLAMFLWIYCWWVVCHHTSYNFCLRWALGWEYLGIFTVLLRVIWFQWHSRNLAIVWKALREVV